MYEILELFGFDILIDDTLKPWLLEVNLTPSLGCDSPLDVRLKSALMADLLTLVGIPAVDPMSRPQTTHLNRSTVTSTKRIVNVRSIQISSLLNDVERRTHKVQLLVYFIPVSESTFCRNVVAEKEERY